MIDLLFTIDDLRFGNAARMLKLRRVDLNLYYGPFRR